MLKYLLLLAILPIILIATFSDTSSDNKLYTEINSLTIPTAHAVPDNLTVSVQIDKTYYERPDTIIVTGQVANVSGFPITVIVVSPLNSIVMIKQLHVAQNGSFGINLSITGEELWKYDGTYILKVNYGSAEKSARTTFDIGISSSNSLTITTDNTTYHEDNSIYISGELNNSHNGTSINISLQSPKGHISPIHNIITSNNSFNTTIPTGNNTSISIPGIYTLTAHYGTETSSTTFDYYLNSNDTQEAYFIPDEQYLTLSDRDITKWTGELLKWQNAQNRTDNNTEFYYEQLDDAISNNQTNRINLFTEKIGHSIALSSLYETLINCLQEQLDLYS